MKMRSIVLCLSVSLATAGLVSAHHSFAMFDTQKEVKLEGVVKEYQWTNPHVWIQLVAKDAKGAEVEWAIECNATSGMLRDGWTRKTLKAGDRISVVINPLKNIAEPGGTLVSATIDGKTLSGGGGGRRNAPGAGSQP